MKDGKKIEEEISFKLRLQKNNPDLEVFIKKEILHANYLEDWQIDYAIQRIKELIENFREEDEKNSEDDPYTKSFEQLITTAKQKRANKHILYGALWCIGGIIVTAISYSATSNGGTYVIAWGAIVFGAIQFFRGLLNE